MLERKVRILKINRVIKYKSKIAITERENDGTSTLLDDISKMDEIGIGDWCIFEKENRILIGLILSFRYLNGKTFKDQSYGKSTAFVQSSGKPVGVLGSWYSWNAIGNLEVESVLQPHKQHSFLPIGWYRGNIRQPSYENQMITISQALVKKLIEYGR